MTAIKYPRAQHEADGFVLERFKLDLNGAFDAVRGRQSNMFSEGTDGKDINHVVNCIVMHVLLTLNGEQSIALIYDCGPNGWNEVVAAQLLMVLGRLGVATALQSFYFWNNHGKMLCDGAFGALKAKLKKRQIACPSDVLSAADEMSGDGRSGPRGDTGLVLLPHAHVDLVAWLSGQYYKRGVMTRRHNAHMFHTCTESLTCFPRAASVCRLVRTWWRQTCAQKFHAGHTAAPSAMAPRLRQRKCRTMWPCGRRHGTARPSGLRTCQ